MCWQMAIRAVRVQVALFVQLRSRLRDHVERIAGSRVQKKIPCEPDLQRYSATALQRVASDRGNTFRSSDIQSGLGGIRSVRSNVSSRAYTDARHSPANKKTH